MVETTRGVLAPTSGGTDGRIVVLGSATCEDTAITKSRLAALGVPFEDVDIDLDPSAEALVRRLNDGHRVTPTVLFGDGLPAVAEPTLEQLGERLGERVGAANDARRPEATQLHGERITRTVPTRRLPVDDGTSFTLDALRGRRQVALFLAHDAGCLACFGYARQLAGQETGFAEADATVVIAVAGTAEEAATWRHGLPAGTRLVGDPDGGWKQQLASLVDVPPGSAIVLLLDRWLAPRVVSAAGEAGGLVDPAETSSWLAFLGLECPECSGEIEWPEVSG